MKSNEIEHASCEKMLTSFSTLSCDKNDRKVRQLTGVCHKYICYMKHCTNCIECGICLECFVSHFEGCTRLPTVLSQVFPGSTVLVLHKVLGAEGAT